MLKAALSDIKKIRLKDLIFGLLIISPLIFIIYASYNPAERSAVERDEARRGVVNSLSRAALAFKAANGTWPTSPLHLNEAGFMDWVPENPEQYKFIASDDGAIVIYAALESLSLREYCDGVNANILYSSVETRTDIVCADTPLPGPQVFAR